MPPVYEVDSSLLGLATCMHAAAQSCTKLVYKFEWTEVKLRSACATTCACTTTYPTTVLFVLRAPAGKLATCQKSRNGGHECVQMMDARICSVTFVLENNKLKVSFLVSSTTYTRLLGGRRGASHPHQSQRKASWLQF